MIIFPKFVKGKNYIDGITGPNNHKTTEGWASNAGYNAAKYVKENGMDSFEKKTTVNYAVDQNDCRGYDSFSPVRYAKAFMKAFDLDKNGKLAYEEFVYQHNKDLENFKGSLQERAFYLMGIQQKFLDMDINQDEEISSSEFAAFTMYQDLMSNEVLTPTEYIIDDGINQVDAGPLTEEQVNELNNMHEVVLREKPPVVMNYIAGFITPEGRKFTDYSIEDNNPVDTNILDELYNAYELKVAEDLIDEEKS